MEVPAGGQIKGQIRSASPIRWSRESDNPAALQGASVQNRQHYFLIAKLHQSVTRSGPKIPAAGYLEGEGFFGFKDIDSDFGCCYEQFWNFVRTTEFWNFVRTTEVWLF